MSALLIIVWFVGLVLSVVIVFHFVGFNGIVNMFPEGGRRWWHLPVQLLALVLFALMVLLQPFVCFCVLC